MAQGKRAGARRASRSSRPAKSIDLGTVLLCVAITLCVIAWGYLVYAAIDFGTSARSGEAAGWGLMALAAVGAMACLFFGLMLGTRLLSKLGIISSDEDAGADGEAPPAPPAGPRPQGGKRAAR